MNFQHVRAFHAIAVHGTAVAAARALGVSQPTLSQQIKALEERHQTSLFERRGGKLVLTPLGMELREATTRLMAAAEDVDLLLQQSGGTELGGRIQVGSDTPAHAAAILAEFRRRHPVPKITLIAGNAAQTMLNLLEGRVDIAIVANPPGAAGFTYQPLAFDPLHVLLPLGHRLAQLDEVPISAIGSETLLIREPQSQTRALIEQILDEAGIMPRETVEFGPREAIREAIAHGIGVGIFIASECGCDARLTDRPLAPRGGRFGLTEYVVCKQDRRHQAVIRAFLSVAEAYSSGQ